MKPEKHSQLSAPGQPVQPSGSEQPVQPQPPGPKRRATRHRKRRRGFDGFTVVKWLVYVFFALFLILPLLSIFLVSFIGEPVNILGSLIDGDVLQTTLQQLSSLSLQPYTEMLGKLRYLLSLWNSVKLALGVAVLVTIVVLPIAYAYARTNMPFKKLFAVLSTVPLVMPTFIAANAFILMFGETGWVNYMWRALGGDGVLFEVKSMLGIVLVQLFFFFPYALWPMVAAFKVSDVTLEEASQNLGAKGPFTFFRVTLPLATPGIISSMLLVFTVSFSDFGTPIFMAPKKLNLIVVDAYREISGFFNWSGSAILTVVMVLVAALFFWLQRLVTKGREYGTISGKPTRQKLVSHKGVTRGLAVYTFIVMFIPLLALGTIVLASLATTWGHKALPDGYTFAHYATIFSSSSENVVNSLVLAFGSLLLSVVIATFVSYFVVRRGSAGLDFLSSIPLVIPGIAIGVAFIQTFNAAPLQLTGTALILIVAYTVRRMPYMIRSTMGTMMAIKRDIEEAAVNLGASPLLAALTVVGPLMLPGISAGAILVFVTVIKETSISVLIGQGDWAPMSLSVFQNMLRGQYYTASAMAVFIIAIVIVLQVVARKLTRDEMY